MDKNNNIWIIVAIILLFLALNQQTRIATQRLSVMDTIVPTATGTEKMVLWWLGIAVISLFLIGSFYWKRK